MEKIVMSFDFAKELMDNLALLKILSKGNGTLKISVTEKEIKEAEKFARDVFNDLCDGLAYQEQKIWEVKK